MGRLRILKASRQHLNPSSSLSRLGTASSHPKGHLDINLPRSMGKGQHSSVFKKVRFWESNIQNLAFININNSLALPTWKWALKLARYLFAKD